MFSEDSSTNFLAIIIDASLGYDGSTRIFKTTEKNIQFFLSRVVLDRYVTTISLQMLIHQTIRREDS